MFKFVYMYLANDSTKPKGRRIQKILVSLWWPLEDTALGLRSENTKMYNPENSKGLRTQEWTPESIGRNEIQKREFRGNIFWEKKEVQQIDNVVKNWNVLREK